MQKNEKMSAYFKQEVEFHATCWFFPTIFLPPKPHHAKTTVPSSGHIVG